MTDKPIEDDNYLEYLKGDDLFNALMTRMKPHYKYGN